MQIFNDEMCAHGAAHARDLAQWVTDRTRIFARTTGTESAAIEIPGFLAMVRDTCRTGTGTRRRYNVSGMLYRGSRNRARDGFTRLAARATAHERNRARVAHAIASMDRAVDVRLRDHMSRERSIAWLEMELRNATGEDRKNIKRRLRSLKRLAIRSGEILPEPVPLTVESAESEIPPTWDSVIIGIYEGVRAEVRRVAVARVRLGG